MKSDGNSAPPVASSANGVRFSPDKQCLYYISSGKQCRAPRKKGTPFCLYHDPDFHKARVEAQAVAERAGARVRPDSAEGVQNLLIHTAEAVVRGEISPAVASSIGYLAQVMVGNLRTLAQERSSFFQAATAADQMELEDADSKLRDLETSLKCGLGVSIAARIELDRAAAAKASAEKEAAKSRDPKDSRPDQADAAAANSVEA